MLKLYDYNINMWDIRARPSVILKDAKNIKVQEEINNTYTLSFECNYCAEISEMKIVEVEGDFYRITSVSNENSMFFSVNCTHIFHYDSTKIHIQNIPDMIAVSPREVLEQAFVIIPNETPFSLFTDDELATKGMKWIDYDEFKIDFFSTDKTTPYDVLQTVISSCGKGELYIENYTFALVERIGYDTKNEIRLDYNAANINITRDATNIITRLYPYGDSDLDISTVEPNGRYYIDSPNINVYGLFEGYKDYTDTEPQALLAHALYEFDERNTSKLDVPNVNISGSIIELNKIANTDLRTVKIGDGINVIDNGVKIFSRIIKVERYPYEPMLGSIQIGNVKKELFFYFNQMGRVIKELDEITTASGFINSKKIR